jgi:alpha-1,2-mannosyltransferase
MRPLVLGFILCASHSRTFSMLNGYGAPLQIYQHLEHHDDTGPGKALQSIPVMAVDYVLA